VSVTQSSGTAKEIDVVGAEMLWYPAGVDAAWVEAAWVEAA